MPLFKGTKIIKMRRIYNCYTCISQIILSTILDMTFYNSSVISYHKQNSFSIDFSYRLKTILGHMVIGFKQVRVSSGNLVPSPSTENHLLSLSELADRK